IGFGLLLVLMLGYGVPPGWGLLFIPLMTLGLAVAALGIGTLLSALTVAYRDFRYVVPFLVQLWMFATPTVYMNAVDAVGPAGPVPRLWHRWGYSAPDMYYEAAVAKLIDERSAWLDVGCGRCAFPENKSLAKMLAARCRRLVGVDPDPAIEENPCVHARSQAP